jgi:23S rRNA (uracil1939-C5)-methyltransferase
MTNTLPFDLGEQFTLDISGLTHAGEGVGRYQGVPVFIPGTIPGDKVIGVIHKVRKRFARGELLTVLEPSPSRRAPLCSRWARCGGCALQNMAYSEQLKWKTNMVRDSLARIGRLPHVPVKDIVGMDTPRHYRNKATYHVRHAGSRITFGFYGRGSNCPAEPENVLDADISLHQECLLPDKDIGSMAMVLELILNSSGLQDYTGAQLLSPSGDGVDPSLRLSQPGDEIDPSLRFSQLEQVVIRKSAATGDSMMILVTKPGQWHAEKALTTAIMRELPELSGLFRAVRTDHSSHVPPGFSQHNLPVRTGTQCHQEENTPPKRLGSLYGGCSEGFDVVINGGGKGRRIKELYASASFEGAKMSLLAGSPFITDLIGDITYRISPASFCQVNPEMTGVLYDKALEYAKLTGEETVVDAYSGIGAVALYMARQAGHVYGLEIVQEAVLDAKANAKLNGIGNVGFMTGAVEKLLPAMVKQGLRPDVVILDPPRRGCDPAVLESATTAGTKRIVYLSCDPGTLARDLRYLADKGYVTKEVQPVDMFPWTAGIETVALLQR